MEAGILTRAAEIVRKRVAEEASKPLSVAVMGQTGVGKSSLLNALFGARLEVGAVRPTTKIPEAVSIAGVAGGMLSFWDMPGIGESDAADAGYLREYRSRLETCDVVLWAMHADSRSTTLDLSALRALLNDGDRELQRRLFSKITFIMTKVDQLNPSPWIYARDGRAGTFQPSAGTSELIAEKSRFFGSALMTPFGELAIASTYNDVGHFNIHDPRFEYDESYVRYHGLLTENVAQELSWRYPEHSAVFDRLAINHQVIACSTRFRYNLLPLLVATVNKLGESAVGRFKNVTDVQGLESVPVSNAASYCDVIVWDVRKNRRQFDLEKLFKE